MLAGIIYLITIIAMTRQIVLLLLSALAAAAIPLLDDDIGQEIFHENKQYVIYVSNIPSQQVIAELSKFCTGNKLCAILEGQNEMYERIVSFVGFNSPDYLLILDVANRLKYCHPITLQFNVQQVSSFFEQFQNGLLSPYYTSQPIPESQTEEHLTKIVGFTFQSFLEQSDKVRVLYLYTDSELCDNCLKVYEEFARIGKQFASEAVEFGFLDLFKNQHPLLKEEDVPVILIYSKDSPSYQKINVENISELASIVRAALAVTAGEDL